MHISVKVFINTVENTSLIDELASEKANLLNRLRKDFQQISLEFSF